MTLTNSWKYVLILLTYLHPARKNIMSKNLVHAHRKQTCLRKRFLKNRTETNRVCDNKQRNFFVSLLRKTKNDYYGHLNEKDMIDIKKFWKTVKPTVAEKCKIFWKAKIITKLQK